MNDWVIIDELINKYSSVIDFRHKNIKKNRVNSIHNWSYI